MVEIHELQSGRIRHASPAYTMAVRLLPAASRVCAELRQKSGMPIARTSIVDSPRSRSSSSLFEMLNSIHHSGTRPRRTACRMVDDTPSRCSSARRLRYKIIAVMWATGSQMTSARAELIKVGGVGS